jgi:predicted metal-dependent HD superfamily phosphohydrolase
MSLREQWVATWKALGATAPAGVYDEVMARYAEPHRHYHTPRHLEECFSELAGVRDEAERPGEVELALWFHDAIYDPTRHDNEQRSADWARSVAASAGLDAGVGERVATMIMATRHDAVPLDVDARVLVDVDLAILGAPPLRFAEYEREVREEYRWVPEAVFRRRRRAILARLLARPQLYNTVRMRAVYEARARVNLERSLGSLRPNVRRYVGVAVAGLMLAIAVVGSIAAANAGVSPWWPMAGALALWLAYDFVIGPRLYSPPPRSPMIAGAAPSQSRYAVTCDDEGVAVSHDGKLVENVRWADVTAVLIRIDDNFLPQPWWIVRSANGGCMYPNEARGAEAAIDALSARLPGFDYAAVIRAMGLMSGGVVVWESSRPAKANQSV